MAVAQSGAGAAVEGAAIEPVPSHVAIIMDGNGRWARERGLPRVAGHRAGTDNIRRIIEAAVEHGVKILTLYAFSTENWKRPMEEVRGLMTILRTVLDREGLELHKNGVRLRHFGSLQGIDPRLVKQIQHLVELTRDNDRITVNVAFNYGGRPEIVEAVRRLVRDGTRADDITEELIDSYLYTAGTPDPDLIIRTAGEMRLSNFLIWQAAYAEYWSTPVFWPDFGKEQLHEAIVDYSRRHRKFGAVNE